MTGAEILANLNKPTIYIGEVMEIYNKDSDAKDALDEPNSIRFTIPGVTDGIVKYPTARLIGNRTKRVKEGDTVFIIKQGSFNNIFFYMPMDISDFIGCAYDEGHKISLVNNEINITSGESKITVGDSGVTITDGKDTISVSNGNIGISTDSDSNGAISISTGKANFSVSTDATGGTIEIKTGVDSTLDNLIKLDPILGMNLGVGSGKFIILPSGAVGFSTGASVASATVPVLPGTAPIVESPNIVKITVTQPSDTPISITNTVKIGDITLTAPSVGGITSNAGSVLNITTTPSTGYNCTVKYQGSVISGSVTVVSGVSSLDVDFSHQS